MGLLSCGSWGAARAQAPSTPIQHVIIIMQENRSFDSYFGTFPGANGIPAGSCVPISTANPAGGCISPYHDVIDFNTGGPHAAGDGQADIDDGITSTRMDGFVQSQLQANASRCAKDPKAFGCSTGTGVSRHDVMGYHTAAEIPNYWTYAQNFVLQDRLFEGVRSWSGPSHLDLVSEWAAFCTNNRLVSTCTTGSAPSAPTQKPGYPWASLFQLLDVHQVSWKYYVSQGSEPDCDSDELTCDPVPQASTVPSDWNPAPAFAWVKANGPAYVAAHNPPVDQFLVDLKNNTLPQVSWILPDLEVSEHPGNGGVTAGMEYVTSLVNAVMQSPSWNSTAIFIAWDDWGGMYDHVVPPNVDMNATAYPVQGFGFRVPGLMISAYARHGMIDHQTLSFENYAILFENLFMGGARLDPTVLGNPDSRPTIRDSITAVTFLDGHSEQVGDLLAEFDFTQAPRPPLLLTTRIPTTIRISCRRAAADQTATCQLPVVSIKWNALVGVLPSDGYTYHVTRDGTEIAGCAGTVTSCTDRPGSGAHLYRVFSIDSHGMASPGSAAAEADEP